MGALDKVLQIFLQNAGGASGREHDEIGVFFCVLAGDVIDDFFLGTACEHVAIDDAGGDGGKVAIALQHRSHDIKIVVPEGRVHDRVNVFKRAGNPQRADVRGSGIHPVSEFHRRTLFLYFSNS